MGGKGGRERTTTQAQIPPELSDLYREGGARILQMQRDLPLSEFMRDSGRFQTAGRAPQFAQAQNLTGSLSAQPQGTALSQQTAQQAAGQAGNVDPRFSQLRGVARRQVGIQPLENKALRYADQVTQNVRQTPGTFAEVRGQADPRIAELIGMAGQRVTGENLQQDPAYQAAINAFQSTIQPTIQNQAALSGLGRSTGLTQSLAAGEAQYLLPVVQDTLAREERALERGLGARQFGITTAADLGLQQAHAEERSLDRYGQAGLYTAGLKADIGGRGAARKEAAIDRELNAVLQQALAGERGTERQQQAMQFLAGTQQAAGAQDLARQQQQFGQLAGLGESEQQYQQGRLDRQTQDYLRRQALAEQALYGPFGQIAPSAIGQQVTSTGGGKK